MADDNLKTAITGAGLGAVLLEVVRRASDAWQKREQARADEKQKLNARPVDASGQLQRYLERQIEDLRRELHQVQQEARRELNQVEEEAREQGHRFDDSERRGAIIRQSVVEFATVVSVLLPEIPEPAQRRLQAALDRMRQVGGLG